MKRLYVGCRVRVNCPVSVSHGVETRITSELQRFDDAVASFFGHEVDIPLEPRDTPGSDAWIGLCAAFEPHELEPIIPEGHQIVSWEACLWTPEGIPA